MLIADLQTFLTERRKVLQRRPQRALLPDPSRPRDVQALQALEAEQVDGAFHNVDEHNIRRYIDDLQKNNKQGQVLADFQGLARKLEEMPQRREATEIARRGCR